MAATTSRARLSRKKSVGSDYYLTEFAARDPADLSSQTPEEGQAAAVWQVPPMWGADGAARGRRVGRRANPARPRGDGSSGRGAMSRVWYSGHSVVVRWWNWQTHTRRASVSERRNGRAGSNPALTSYFGPPVSEMLPSYDSQPAQMTGGPMYCQAIDGRWYPVRNAATGELLRWPSMADVGEPERPVNPSPFWLGTRIVGEVAPDVVVESCP